MSDMPELASCTIRLRYNPTLTQGDGTADVDNIMFSFYNGFRIVGDPSLPAVDRLLTPLMDEPNNYELRGTGKD